MRRLATSFVVALVVAAVAGPIATSDAVQHPDRCTWASNVGDFCAHWNSTTQSYIGTPAGVPGDWLRGTPGGLTDGERAAIVGAIFVGAWLVVWLVLSATAGRLPKPRDGSAT